MSEEKKDLGWERFGNFIKHGSLLLGGYSEQVPKAPEKKEKTRKLLPNFLKKDDVKRLQNDYESSLKEEEVIDEHSDDASETSESQSDVDLESEVVDNACDCVVDSKCDLQSVIEHFDDVCFVDELTNFPESVYGGMKRSRLVRDAVGNRNASILFNLASVGKFVETSALSLNNSIDCLVVLAQGIVDQVMHLHKIGLTSTHPLYKSLVRRFTCLTLLTYRCRKLRRELEGLIEFCNEQNSKIKEGEFEKYGL